MLRGWNDFVYNKLEPCHQKELTVTLDHSSHVQGFQVREIDRRTSVPLMAVAC